MQEQVYQHNLVIMRQTLIHQPGQAGQVLLIMQIQVIMTNINIHSRHHQVEHSIIHSVTVKVLAIGFMEVTHQVVEEFGMEQLT